MTTSRHCCLAPLTTFVGLGLLACLALPLAGCTADASCSTSDDCFRGQRCRSGTCVSADVSNSPDGDATSDTATDSAADSALDTASDTAVDTARDTTADATADAPTDTAGDAGPDTSADTSPPPDTADSTPTIREVRMSEQTLDLGERSSSFYTIGRAVVTGVQPNIDVLSDGGFAIQDPTENDTPPDRSGLWVNPDPDNHESVLQKLERGSVVRIRAKLTNWDEDDDGAGAGQLLLRPVSALTVRSQDATLPAPITVDGSTADWSIGSFHHRAHENMRLEVTNIEITASSTTHGDLPLANDLYLGHELVDGNPLPTLGLDNDPKGRIIESIVGVLAVDDDHLEILPRGPDDLTLAPE